MGIISLFTFPGEVRTIYSGIGIYYLDFTLTQRVGVRVDYTVEPKINDIKKKIVNLILLNDRKHILGITGKREQARHFCYMIRLKK